jgi:hypothetical protein
MRNAALFLSLLLPTAALAQAPAPAAQPASPPGFTAPPRANAPEPAPAAPVVADRSSVEVSKTARTDRDVFIGSYITIDKTCKVGDRPTVDFTQPPKNGTLRTRKDPVNLQSAPGIPRGRCLGVSPAGISVIYRSKARFKGDDSFLYTVSYPDGRVREVKGTVSIQ